MKKISVYVGSAILGSAFTLGAVFFFQPSYKISVPHAEQTTSKHIVQTTNFNNAHSSSSQWFDFTEASAKVMPTVVHIATATTVRSSAYPPGFELWQEFFGPQWGLPQQQEKKDVRKGSGSGVIVQKDGYIVTNNHVIQDADEITVTLNDKRSFTATVIGADPNTDLALIKIDADSLDIIEFTNSDAVKVGEWVLAVGNPFNLNSTVTAGIVSAKGRNINILKQKYAIESFIQTDAAINPGNSGGALTNATGELIGINTAIASPTGSYSGYGFAVPSNIVSKVIFDIKTYGFVQRGFLGVSIREVNAELVKEKKLTVSEGAYIESVIEQGAAKKAGIEPGDVITEIDGIKITSPSEIQEIIGRRSPGEEVAVTVVRKSATRTLQLILTNKDGEQKLSEKATLDLIAALGISVKDADAKLLKTMNLKSGVQVTAIETGVVQKHTNMRQGFVITKVDNVIIKNAEQFTTLINAKKGGVLIEGSYPDAVGTFYYAFGL